MFPAGEGNSSRSHPVSASFCGRYSGLNIPWGPSQDSACLPTSQHFPFCSLLSMNGHSVVPQSVVHFYSATKYAVTALTEGLRQELREAKTHIRATVSTAGCLPSAFAGGRELAGFRGRGFHWKTGNGTQKYSSARWERSSPAVPGRLRPEQRAWGAEGTAVVGCDRE